ncbi:ATP-binding protein [Halarcobacter sp.]|uniref:sensor histidine kinase n=1 Tax=Halarcobacter sp. TaxID=2321133 RepID=UPI0029F5A2BC|nr:ATP-binding protein [Halarcobacter sp.]
MKFNIDKLQKNTSTKTKTTVLVIGMFFVLSLFFVYMQYATTKEFIQESQKAYEKKLNSIFEESIIRVEKFYHNRGLANLNSYGIQEALSNQDKNKLYALSKNRWKILRNENRFLKSMIFFDKDKNLLTYLGESPANNITPSNNSLFIDTSNNHLNYIITISSKNNGYLVFMIDSIYFLSEIYELANIESYIVSNDKTKPIISLKNSKGLSLTNYLTKQKNEVPKLFNLDSNIFTTHHIKINNVVSDNSFEILFFQDITSGQQRLSNTVLKSFFLISILGTIALIVMHYGFKVLIVRLEESQEELSSLNKNLEKRVEEEVALKTKKEKEAKEKERILVHQSKLASMGEMIGSIAHQWRQPLTQLSSILVFIELLYEKNKLTKEELRGSIQEAEEQIKFMSKTIDDFRNFFKPDKEKKVFSPKQSIEKSLSLISSSLENHKIKVAIDFKNEFTINGYENEFSQVILNILSNAKDILIEEKIKNPQITIKVDKYKNKSQIQICDNAGGIKLSPLEKVFEPYVSTKHASTGTGIGLYMSKNIIEKSMNGSLSVHNNEKGACFTILL